MLGTFFYLLGFVLPLLIIGSIGPLISKAKWVDSNFPQLANKLSKVLNLEITKKESLFGISIGQENSNHFFGGGKHKTKISVKYFYNYKSSFSYDIVKWEYGKEQSIDDIICSIMINIDNTESLLNHNSR